MRMRVRASKFLKEVRFYAGMVVVAVVLAIGLRVFLVESIISIPSRSMEPTVLAGDKIIVSKQIPGPRVYRDIRHIRVDGKVQTIRFKGIRPVRRNDVLVFNFPYTAGSDSIDMDLSVLYLKRCVALPGDTFSIENGIYRVTNYPDSLGCLYRQQEMSQKSQQDIWRCYPYDTEHYEWTVKDFGPLYVPRTGDRLSIDTVNYVLYMNLITYETDLPVAIRGDSVWLGDEPVSHYTFQMNYYFMAGDDIFDSADSRYWGLLPEDHIIGKAAFVWRSTDPRTGKIRWDRFLKIIR